MTNLAKPIIVISFIALILIFLLQFTMFSMAKKSGKRVYTISVTDYRGENMYVSDSIISQSDRTIKFVDAFGFEKTISGNYITVTKY